jgi:hypothetical protein
MSMPRMGWALPVAALGLLTTTALPAGEPGAPPGGIAALLRARQLLPRGTLPTVSEVVLKGDQVTLTRQRFAYQSVPMRYKVVVYEYVSTLEEVTVLVNGRPEKQKREVVKAIPREQERTTNVTQVFPQLERQTVALASLRAFVVGPQGKLEPLDRDRLAGLLRKGRPALVGDTDDIDPRFLELVRPGVVYLSVSPTHPPAPPG